jgi:hypothetical protein
MLLCRLRTPTLQVVFLFLTGFPFIAAQQPAESDGVESGRVIGRVWHTNLQMQNAFEYLNKVRGELGVPASPVMFVGGGNRMDFISGGGMRLRGAKPAETSGTLFVLQTLPEVSFNKPVAFQTCESLERFKELVRSQKEQMGPAAELIGDEDRIELRLNLQQQIAQSAPLPAPKDGPAGETRVLSIVVTSTVQTTDEPGEKPPEIPKSISTWYRYVDGIAYSSSSNALFTMTLPGIEGLRLDEEHVGQDLHADFDLTQIPSDFRQAFWTALEGQASVFLQRFDNEAEGQYSLRRVLAEGRLELLKRAMFDVERVRFSLQLSPATGQPVVSRLRIQARENSVLASFLSVVSNQGTQLTGLQDEQSPLVLSTTLVIPEFVRPFASAFVASAGLLLNESTQDTPSAGVLITDLVTALQETISTGILDATVCLRGTVETGLIPCGAIRVESADKLLAALEFLLQVSDLKDHVTVTPDTIGDYRMISIRSEKVSIPLTDSSLPAQLNLAATGSWLWMTVGDQRGVEMLDAIVNDSEQSLNRTGAAVPLLVRLKLSRWLGTTEDQLSRVPAQWLNAAERWLQSATAPRMSISFNGNSTNSPVTADGEFTSYAAKALTPEDSDVELKVRSAEQELLVDARVGTGLARFAVAQYLDAQSRMFKGFSMPITIGGPNGKATLKMTAPKGGAATGGQFNIKVGTPDPTTDK